MLVDSYWVLSLPSLAYFAPVFQGRMSLAAALDQGLKEIAGQRHLPSLGGHPDTFRVDAGTSGRTRIVQES